ncbi:hypothetical protein G6L94_28815 [Agrobacterium rhizogenes]|uniref:hypothetical protein n=1 Tax=Rhizobium rhizogenes TaxID=359 RepID=UPI0004D81237|nr:hypothetical protein [Rhizobium rhizogenes]OCJ02253.1 hypothetical protein A6U85_08810 [Agrobacterium sp. 13-626]OCJ19576.1 hypothetical protein A6U89_15905 [Agrobacterium sp. B133/95]KEA08812.1 hypothetical protein CN09_24405 [Rhizobium rhizogenes]MQB30724.1 hypothetical protein [Rhizobium rhizogenes]NTF65273.1 hypothetical protein [Rhizobium rhizogenes]
MRNTILRFKFSHACILLCTIAPSNGFPEDLKNSGRLSNAAETQGVVPSPTGTVNALDYGLVSDPSCTIDATKSLNAAVAAAAGRKLILPLGTFCLNTATSTLKIASTTEIQGQGAGTIIQWNAPSGSPAAPVVDVLASAPGTVIDNLSIDALPKGASYTTPAYFGGNPWGGVAFVIQADRFHGTNLRVSEGYNNCIGIGAMKGSVGVWARPSFVVLDNIHTSNCGSGDETSGPILGHNGAGIDNGGGSGAIISNAIDVQSYVGFINDIGGGAYGTWSNISSYGAKIDPKNSHLDQSGIGFATYSPNSVYSNIAVYNPESYGIWSDFYADDSVWSNVLVKNPKKYCVNFKGPATFNNLQCTDPSAAGLAAYPALLIDTSGAPWVQNLTINNFSLSGKNQSVAIQATSRTTKNNMTGLIMAGPLSGVNAAYSIDSTITGLQIVSKGAHGVGYGNPSAAYPWDFAGTLRAQASAANVSWKTCAYGSNACTNSGNVYIADFASPEKRLGMGYDPVNDLFVFQSIQAGALAKPLALNPSGGSVQIGQQSLPTNASAGFPYIPATAGAPTGVPTPVNGMVPMQYDTTNHKLWIYDGGWKSVTVN